MEERRKDMSKLVTACKGIYHYLPLRSCKRFFSIMVGQGAHRCYRASLPSDPSRVAHSSPSPAARSTHASRCSLRPRPRPGSHRAGCACYGCVPGRPCRAKRGLAWMAAAARAAARSLPSSFSTATAQPDPAMEYSAYQGFAESTCYKRIFKVFQRYVVSVSYRCCKSRSGCFTCCKCFRSIWQAFVQNVSSVPDVCGKRVDVVVAYVSHICCNSTYVCLFQS